MLALSTSTALAQNNAAPSTLDFLKASEEMRLKMNSNAGLKAAELAFDVRSLGPLSGTIRAVLRVSIRSPGIVGSPLSCSASFGQVSESPAFENYDSGSAGGVVTATTGTCIVTLPFSWATANRTGLVRLAITAYMGSRYTYRLIVFKAPANNATTTRSFNVTM
jgi:hypothetical protein